MARLIIRKGSEERIVQATDDEITIGRADDNLIVLDDKKVSRNHCAIKRTDKGYVVVDLESRNGVRVNKVKTKEKLLADGDQILVGDHVIVLSEPTEMEKVVQGDAVNAKPNASDRPPIRVRFGKGRLFSKKERRAQTEIMRKPKPAVAEKKPEPPPLPIPISVQSPDETEDGVVPLPAQIKVTIPKPETPPPSPTPVPPSSEPSPWKGNVKKFYLVEPGGVRLFSKPTSGDPRQELPIESILCDHPDVLPFEDLFKIEHIEGEKEFDSVARAVLLTSLKDKEDGGLTYVMVDTAGVVSLVESPAGEGDKAVRKIVGRGIDLAARLAADLNIQQIVQQAKGFWTSRGQRLDEAVVKKFGKLPSQAFWKKVASNLKQGRVRMIYLIPEPTTTVQRVVDFLHARSSLAAYGLQMDLLIERGVENPRKAFISKVLEPSKSARAPKATADVR